MTCQSSNPGTGVSGGRVGAARLAGTFVVAPAVAPPRSPGPLGVGPANPPQPPRTLATETTRAIVRRVAGRSIRRGTVPSSVEVIDGDDRGHPERQARPGRCIRGRLPRARAPDLARLRGRGCDDPGLPFQARHLLRAPG